MLITIPDSLLPTSKRENMASVLTISARRSKDTYVTNTLTEHNPEGTAYLLDGMQPAISEIAKKDLHPVATWSRIYRNGATLREHTDRDGLHWAISICLKSDHEWALECYIDKEWQSFYAKEGMGIVTYVRKIPHRRQVFEGKLYVALLLHYKED